MPSIHCSWRGNAYTSHTYDPLYSKTRLLACAACIVGNTAHPLNWRACACSGAYRRTQPCASLSLAQAARHGVCALLLVRKVSLCPPIVERETSRHNNRDNRRTDKSSRKAIPVHLPHTLFFAIYMYARARPRAHTCYIYSLPPFYN